MRWKIAEAKQQLSALLRRAQEEPQMIYNRDRLSAVVLGADEYARFERWRSQADAPTLADGARGARRVLAAEGYELALPRRRDRANAAEGLADETAG